MTRKSRSSAAPKRNTTKAASARAATPMLAGMPERGLKIGEAAEVIGVATYVLRFWETQFPFLKPRHSRTRHRFYHDRDLDMLRLIKRLLHQEGFTIAGANKHIRENGIDALLSGKTAPAARTEAHAEEPEPKSAEPKSAVDGQTRRVLSDVRRDLESLHKLLEE
ncbi:MAG: MerR family transcriptional regulator [Candidatus Binataceae bacterium]